MRLIPRFVGQQIHTSLQGRVDAGRMPILSPSFWKLSGILPRFRDRRGLLWRVNEVSPTTCSEPDLESIWDEVCGASSWAMPSQAVLWMWHFLQQKRPRTIVEFGSGISTLLFASYALANPTHRVQVLTIDHEQAWIDTVNQKLAERQLDRFITTIHAPIVSFDDASESSGVYAPRRVRRGIHSLQSQIDFVLIDGPPAHLYGRGGTLPQVLPWLSDKATVLLDDACRPHEFQLCSDWEQRFASLVRWQGTVPIGHGIGVFRRKATPTARAA